MRHQLRHVHRRIVCSPSQPSQPAESALDKNSTPTLTKLRLSSAEAAR